VRQDNPSGITIYLQLAERARASDGIGDTPYVIDANTTDYYPLMNPYSPNSLSVDKMVVGEGFTMRVYFAGTNCDNYSETFNVTVYANTTLIALVPKS